MSNSNVVFLQSKEFTIPKYKNPTDLDGKIYRGWLRNYLFSFDSTTWGRWDYWLEMKCQGKLLDTPIPQITFENAAHPLPLKMLNNCIEHAQEQGYGYIQAVEFLINWILYGFADPTIEKLSLPVDSILHNIWYQIFVLPMLQLWPYDYFGELLSQAGYGQKSNAFYPTPLSICDLMTRLLNTDKKISMADTVHDPCVGTGRTLLEASNCSLRLSGGDINGTVLDALRINFWLYAPWGVAPLPDQFFEDSDECETLDKL